MILTLAWIKCECNFHVAFKKRSSTNKKMCKRKKLMLYWKQVVLQFSLNGTWLLHKLLLYPEHTESTWICYPTWLQNNTEWVEDSSKVMNDLILCHLLISRAHRNTKKSWPISQRKHKKFKLYRMLLSELHLNRSCLDLSRCQHNSRFLFIR